MTTLSAKADSSQRIITMECYCYEIEVKKHEEQHRKLLDLLREVRYAQSRYDQSADQSDFDEINEKQIEILNMFDELKEILTA